MHNLIFLDTETTGNEVEKDRLCQICFKTANEIYVGYFKPPLPMSVKAMSVTHITNKMLEGREIFVQSETFGKLQELLKTGIMVAHNATFDKAILEAEGIEVPKFICTLRVARHLDKDNKIPEYNLQYLRYYLDLEVDGAAHDAENDVKVLEKVFERLLAKVKEDEGGDEDKAIEKMVEISSRPSLFTQISFGKHAGKRIEDVLKTDRSYLEWLLRTKLENEKNEEDWIYTLEHYLKK